MALAPLLRRKQLPVTLAPNAREHFRGGGADSLGTATDGEEVRANAMHMHMHMPCTCRAHAVHMHTCFARMPHQGVRARA